MPCSDREKPIQWELSVSCFGAADKCSAKVMMKASRGDTRGAKERKRDLVKSSGKFATSPLREEWIIDAVHELQDKANACLSTAAQRQQNKRNGCVLR